MKLSEKDYFAQNYKLVTAAGKTFESVSVLKLPSKDNLKPIEAAEKGVLSVIEFDSAFAGTAPDEFDESFLAAFRESLKNLEGTDSVFLLKPLLAGAVTTEEAAENLNALFYHIARRLKDCACVAGFDLSALDADIKRKASVIDALKKKHPEYVYLLKNKEEVSAIEAEYPGRLVLY
ncbi:MAG: hypothetical protein J5798_02140 [Spirochaetaceae bacterium]|nr:hypothetical protein [Spirochaetaceae bacterium]